MQAVGITPCSDHGSVINGSQRVEKDAKSVESRKSTKTSRGSSPTVVSQVFMQAQRALQYVSSKISGLLEHVFAR